MYVFYYVIKFTILLYLFKDTLKSYLSLFTVDLSEPTTLRLLFCLQKFYPELIIHLQTVQLSFLNKSNHINHIWSFSFEFTEFLGSSVASALSVQPILDTPWTTRTRGGFTLVGEERTVNNETL